MAFSLFFNHSGDSLTSIFEIVIPEYRGQASGDSTITSISKFVLSILKLSTEGIVNEWFFLLAILFSPASKSLAEPMWEVASARLGVSPISKTQSSSTLKYS